MAPQQSSKAQSETGAPFKVKLCGFYAHGACTRGSLCSFAHGTDELKSRQGRTSKAQNNSGNLPSPAQPGAAPWLQSSRGAPRQDGLAVTEQDEYYQPFLAKTKMCKFFAMGACARGTECKFAHTKEELRPQPDLRPIKLCPSLVKKGTCAEVDCPFSHSGHEMETARLNLQGKSEASSDKDTSYDSSSSFRSIAESSSSTEPFDKPWDADSYSEPEIGPSYSEIARRTEPSLRDLAIARFAKLAEPEFVVSVRNSFLTFTAKDQDASRSPFGSPSLRRCNSSPGMGGPAGGSSA